MISRRGFLLTAAAAPLVGCAFAAPRENGFASAIQQIEKASGGRLGVATFDTGRKIRLNYRGAERFPMCSTFKVLASSSILARGPEWLGKRIHYSKDDLVTYSPVTEKHVADGMTNAELCAATLQLSDNTAANLLMKQIGGPAAVTAFARSLGDTEFRLDRWETELNSAIPGDVRDTTTPVAMMETLEKIALGDALPPAQRAQLVDWMATSTTGFERIRAGVPAGWKVADKTGSGSYGTTNTIAVVWPPNAAPIVIVVFFTQPEKHADNRSDVVAAATRAVVAALAAA
ncbi:class A beta-lactamase [Massilia sp. R2A-15]|uniref:class A beta-lactamase n=1 Tax=Massilia sp. R2A-15 TaxID=3064278 RepID=UPI00273556FA|nr:class A beta-lactamase [Massilia sp. R2A-15]WLI89138.1 class A beta-lactamase [Massilia sp. R2A-15]